MQHEDDDEQEEDEILRVEGGSKEGGKRGSNKIVPVVAMLAMPPLPALCASRRA